MPVLLLKTDSANNKTHYMISQPLLLQVFIYIHNMIESDFWCNDFLCNDFAHTIKSAEKELVNMSVKEYMGVFPQQVPKVTPDLR
mmetsp:Transcript_21345/g.43070  ORF Transcript_21345/g.43070 Transcript_21345/m.43070 type:complete len:85 (+) Transcript_21345:790-1044(+)